MTKLKVRNGITGNASSREQQTAELVRLVETVTSVKLPVAEGASEPNDQDRPHSSNEELVSRFLGDLPDEGLGSNGFGEAISVLSQHSVNNSSPGFLGKLVSAPSPPGIASDLFLSTINNNGHVWRASPALSAVEKNVSVKLARMFGLQGPHAGGVTVPGGAAGAMLAMLVARNILSPESKEQGVNSLKKYAVFLSDSAHYSVSNAAQIVGLGSDSIVRVPTLDDGTMDIQQLELSVEAAIQRGRTPLFINATAGNTINGAFDSIDKIGAIARKANAWFHVDACWGGAVVFSEKLKHRIKGCELADSIGFNPHKMLGVPLVCAFLLAGDLRTFWLANKLSAGYLFHDVNSSTSGKSTEKSNGDWRDSKLLDDAPEVADIRDLASLTVQCSRRSDATKMLLHWIYYGTREIGKQIEQTVDVAQHLANLVQSHRQLELVGDPAKVFAQVCFYWGPDASAGSSAINTRNTRLIYERLTEQGWKIDYAPGKINGELLRVACNRLTTRRGVESLVSKLVEAGNSLIDSS
ncbi:hypothetical protein AK830_g3387 [Neonectria ditissima]|uniref:L-aspartate decarboxylase dtxS4 n=1 Tax=Neonectria ditissima TaxID=78410 RepID=A0A0P7BQ89_9HYPO|nr:hypothetical protein AK830_g3387 [Neonectria ditissima]